MRFSIIIPVYNVERYIDRCLDTVMHQSFSDYEVIVVDDESPDNSMAIVQKYAKSFPGKIQVFHQKNTRQGGARNRGVQYAKGDYILFVDSDDYVSPDMLQTVDAYLQRDPCDILIFQYAPVSEEGERLPFCVHAPFQPGKYSPSQERSVVLLPTGPVNKAFRREFYLETGFQFPEKLLYEDAVTRLLYAAADSILVCEEVLYYYVQSRNSSMRQKVSDKMLDILTVTDKTLALFEEKGLYQDFREPLDCALIYGIQYVLDPINRADPTHPIQYQMADYLEQTFPDYRDNPYLSQELKNALDCLLTRDFKRYHRQFLLKNQIKEWLLGLPGAAALNRWRKGKQK